MSTHGSAYRPEVIDLAAEELARRNIPFSLSVNKRADAKFEAEGKPQYSRAALRSAGTLFILAAYYLLRWILPAHVALGLGVFVGMLGIHPFVHAPLIPFLRWAGIGVLSAFAVAALAAGTEWLRAWLPPPVADGVGMFVLSLAWWGMPTLIPPAEDRGDFMLWLKLCLFVVPAIVVWNSIVYLLFGSSSSSFFYP